MLSGNTQEADESNAVPAPRETPPGRAALSSQKGRHWAWNLSKELCSKWEEQFKMGVKTQHRALVQTQRVNFRTVGVGV